MVKIVNKISNNKNHFTGVNPCKFITIHETGNTSRGSNALNHAKFINNGSKATWHYTVDKDNIVQHFNDDIQCWHAGDGTGKGNTQSIGVEMCINSDGNYLQTINRTVDLVFHLMKKHNIPLENIKQHNFWSGKNCPMLMRSGKNGITWNQFLSKIKSKFNNDKQTNDNKKLYKVQVGAFAFKENAIKLQKELISKGYKDTFIKYE